MPLSAIQVAHYDELLAAKTTRVRELLLPFSPPEPQVYASPPDAFRMRAEFRMWHDGDALDYVMFGRDDSKTPVVINHFPIVCARMQQLMPLLRTLLQADPVLRRKLFQVEFLSTSTEDTLVTLIYHRRLDDGWQARASSLAAQLGIAVVGRSRKQKIVIGREYVTESLTVDGACYRYRHYEQAFTQPNAAVNTRMIEWASACAETLHGDLLELYCGNGNFTLPLAQYFDHVIATELSKASIRAARENLTANHIENVHMVRLSAEEVAQAIAGERVFRRLSGLPKQLGDYALNTLFVDPPRAGLDAQTLQMAAGFGAVIYISCNPHSLVQNLAQLCQTHHIDRFALFDQFPYTEHMECGVLVRRTA